MDTDQHEISSPPPPLEEGYWQALLHEGKFAEPLQPREKPYRLNSTHDNYTHIQSTIDDTEQYIIDSEWQEMQAIMQADETIDLQVIGYNRGGLLVEWQHLRGFVPASQLVQFDADNTSLARQNQLIEKVGDVLTLRVIELDQEQNRLVFSERAARVEPGKRAEILDNVQAGTTVDGIVTNVTDFGAFIDLGGIEGLIHISELSWGRVAHPGDIVQHGEHLTAYVLDTQKEAGRIALSLKRLYEDPWRTVADEYDIGDVIPVRVTNVVDFGAFACIKDGLEGLIHVSELAEGHFLHPRNVVGEGQQVQVRILSIDPHNRRLGLSLRQVLRAKD